MSTPPSNTDPQQPPPGQNPHGDHPPQGQDPYGQQPPYGQQQNQPQSPYGYQAAQPSGYSYPAGSTPAPAAKPPMPKEVNLAFWLIIAAGALYFISSIMTAMDPLGNAGVGLDQIESSGVDPDTVAGLISTLSIVLGIVFTGLYVLIAFFIRKGKNWARITGTVFAALSIFGIASGILPAVYTLLGIAGIVLCFLKPSNEYFKPQPARY
ncbi:hypothetical protein [Arthrobacter sp. H5]|uniref:hypothetical protein n=1 Tax=Arthrobacter sp. H5 TaxID=1267973 RepID=UPI0012DD3129|nr:hypothetical protein [Arthrobacter sp. H5]